MDRWYIIEPLDLILALGMVTGLIWLNTHHSYHYYYNPAETNLDGAPRGILMQSC